MPALGTPVPTYEPCGAPIAGMPIGAVGRGPVSVFAFFMAGCTESQIRHYDRSFSSVRTCMPAGTVIGALAGCIDEALAIMAARIAAIEKRNT